MTVTDPTSALARLRGSCELHLPGEPGYDAARTAWNLTADLRPVAVAVPRSTDAVRAVVRTAAEAGLRVAPLSTGHGAGPLAAQDLSDVILLRLSELTGVQVDPEARTARVEGATLWSDVLAATAPHGLTALHGSGPDVAVAGYALGGGLSFYGRTHGLAVNSIRAVEVVTADGELVFADPETQPDLHWGVRGGGANLGIVVALEIDLLPYADVYAGMLLWDRSRAQEVLTTWLEWTRSAPESATTSLRVMSFPPLPELPPFLSGRDLVVVDGAVLETDERAAEVLAGLRALEPEMDTFARIPAAGLLDVHMDPPVPSAAVSDHSVLGPLDADAVTTLLGQVGPGTSSGVAITELRHLGGALGRPLPHGGALSAVGGDYALMAITMTPFPEMLEPGLAAVRGVVAALAPWSQASLIPTFTERAADTSAMYDGDDWARLARLRATLDPAGLLVAHHRV